MADVVRPDPFRWLWYAFGGTLPERHREWVLHDLTAHSWLWRFGARALLRLLPLTLTAGIVLWLVGAPTGLAIASVFIGLLVGFYFSLSYAVESAEKRAEQHGFAVGTAVRVRDEKAASRRPDVQARYDAEWRRPPA